VKTYTISQMMSSLPYRFSANWIHQARDEADNLVMENTDIYSLLFDLLVLQWEK
jgi:hypothetical protein